MKKLTLGILAHVDAGKTTLSEAILYNAKIIKELGRVDQANSFLDYEQAERSRGITVYSKEFSIDRDDFHLTFIDTPGHVDFSSEMERSLAILDYAIVLVDANENIKSHTANILKLLEIYQVPTFIFINKMDRSYFSKDQIMEKLNEVDPRFVSIDDEKAVEKISLLDDKLLNEYLEKADIEEESIKEAINDRKLFPCYFGSALKNEGVNELLDGIEQYAKEPDYGKVLALRVYKISFAQGIRLTHIKLLGGKIRVKDVLPNGDKIDQIRIYQGNRFTTVNEADPGSVCVLKGPTLLRTFDTIGIDQDIKTIFNPYTSYTLQFDPGIDSFKLYKDLKGLEAEYPEIHFEYKEASRDISVSSMGEIQNQILAGIIKQRFNIDVTFGSFKIDYRETITRKVEGVGHFEPLRHYAEVHLLLEPLERGSGIVIDTICPLDLLSSQYQNQVLNILQESNLRGVLTNSPLTDIKITLVSGRAHVKHTEGGDFKEATFRALRQGLLNAGSILLEAMLSFTLEIPSNYLSTAVYDLDQLKAQYQITYQDDKAIITGKGPAQGLNNYQTKALNYSKGEAVYQAIFAGYEEMEDSDKVIEDIAYDPLNDPENPAFSVFTHNGRSEIIAYDEVFNYMHLDSFKEEAVSDISTYKPVKISDKELEAVMNRIAKKKEPYKEPEKKVRPVKESKPEQVKPVVHKPKLLIVDGYNMINGFTAFKNDAKSDYNFARNNFIDLMANYAGYYGSKIILVFDAYRAPNKTSHSETYGNLEVVYTRYQQDADSYIEKFIHDNRDKYQISVATSDRMIQNAALSSGARRISARELEAIIEKTVNE